MLLVLFSVLAYSMCTHQNNVLSCLLPKWLCGNSCTWANDVRLPIAGTNEPTMTAFYIRAFQMELRGGRWVSPCWGRRIIYFARREIFFTQRWEPEEQWFWPFKPFSKLTTASFKIKISMICVYKEHEIKTAKVQEQWLQLKMKFSMCYNMKTITYWGGWEN